jgi:hypothetical protein
MGVVVACGYGEFVLMLYFGRFFGFELWRPNG